MPHAPVNEIELYYETEGDPDGEPLLLIMGLGAQLVVWEDELVSAMAERGYHVIRFDNRDVGLSTSFAGHVDGREALMAFFAGELEHPPYRLGDMAADVAALLDHLELEQVHVLGASMGGMIAQQLTIDHGHLVKTLTSVMSTTGDPDVGQPTPEALGALVGAFGEPVRTLEDAVAAAITTTQVIGSPGLFDEDRVRRRAERSYSRNPDASGTLRQLLAILASPSRSEALRRVEVPTLVIHGSEDPLVQPDGGVRTAESVPGAELHLVEGMGHDVDPAFWPQLLELLGRHTSRAPIGV
jgi:pimeloyl-ACP methyl ester carboxylesterase